MARLLTVLLLISCANVFTEAAVKVGLCPRAQPSGTSSSCTDDSSCQGTHKCCTYNNNKRCVPPLIPNYMAKFFITGLPQANNEMQSLNTYVEDTFRGMGAIGDLVIERFVSCVRVFLNLETENEPEIDIKMMQLENDPVHISGFTGGPFVITSKRSDKLCPDAAPNFNAHIYIMWVNGTSTPGQAKAVLSGLIGNKGKGWEYSTQQIGGCMEIFMEAVLTREEETAVLQVLTNIEQNGITLNDTSKAAPLNVTSNNNEAAVCYENYYQDGCRSGENLCPNIHFCIPEDAFCDGKDDCGDFSDELACTSECPLGMRACANEDLCLDATQFCNHVVECSDGSDEKGCFYFEFYTINITTDFAWDPDFHNVHSSYFGQARVAVESYISQSFLTVKNYSSSHVLTFRKTEDNKTSIAVELKFRGRMDATTVYQKQADMPHNGIISGFITIPVMTVVPIKQGRCLHHECGTGLCVISNDQAHCRCRLGQDPIACAPIDCRGAENYCHTNVTKSCLFSPHHSGYRCKCPRGFSGDHCEVDVCSKLGESACTVSGQCVGDMYNFTLCTCDDFFAGALCEDRGNDMDDTMCQRQRKLHHLFLGHLDGTGEQVNTDFLNGNTLPQQLATLGYQQLEVPTCYDNTSSPMHGYYHHICIYNIANASAGNICYCTNGNGTYNGLDYVDGHCIPPDNFDPEAKPGSCPHSADSIRFECQKDSECTGNQKCCRYGAGRQCKNLLKVKPAECPAPHDAVTAWVCESDGDCIGHQKCCTEGHGQLCREPLYVTRFQIKIIMNADWNDRFRDFNDSEMVSLQRRLVGQFSDLKGFRELTFQHAEAGSLKLTFEVVASPEVTLEEVEQKATLLEGQTFMFDRMNRFVSNASLVTHNFCGSLGCGTGTCVNSTRGAKCLCPIRLFGDKCQFADPCEAGMCQNGGTCESNSTVDLTGKRDYQYTCHCAPGYMGATCEVVVCDLLPQGLCNNGTCVGNLNGGVLCSCPLDKRGIFCQENGTEIHYSVCELRKRLDAYLAQVLRGQATIHTGMDGTGLQGLLTSLDMEWLPLFSCEHKGEYTLTAEMLSVADRNTVRYICLDTSGSEETNCESKVCTSVGSICQNNATCVGNINLQLCDCHGTGHHGAMCDQPGEDEVTECELKHNLAQLTLDALGGSLQVAGMTSQQVRDAITTLLSDIHRSVIWQPNCTKGGSDAYRGCEFQVPGTSSKVCFCVTDKGERLADGPSSTTGLPECPMYGACSEFTTDPCGDNGRCIGDINAGSICECETGYYGIMCRSTFAATLTDCQHRIKLANYLLNIMHGYLEKPIELSGTVQQLLETAEITRLEVPSCTDAGNYQHICTYTIDTAEIDECRCTNDDGTYRMNTDGQYCQNIAKPGECPALPSGTAGITIQECNADKDCNASRKCCAIGSGRQCRDPDLVSVFRVNVTLDAASSMLSGIQSRIKPQMEDVFRALPGYRGVTIVEATSPTSNSIELIVEVKASVDVTAADINNALNRLRAAEFTLGSSTTLYTVSNATLVDHGHCVGEHCGTGMCVDTSYGARCVCPEGATGDMCQYIVPSCNCSLGLQCLRGAHPEIMACACYPENDASCKLPMWYCEGKADCRTDQKCVHEADCDSCETRSSCISMTQTHTCDSQPCQHGGMCVAKSDGTFTCRCRQGFGGSRCERNDDVCKVVPSNACTRGCVGDIHVGILCDCLPGRAGINCDQPGHSRCEQQQALFSDLVKISRNHLKVPDVTQTQLHMMLTRLMAKMDVDSLPLTNCTADGGFNPVQCQLHLSSGNETCHCVERNHGKPISSNVLAYPGFAPCTAPYSPEVTGEMLCSTTLSSVCRNGGTCVGNLLNGTMCQCPSSYQGIFCQDRASDSGHPDPPRSVCEFSLEVWKLMRKALTSGDRTLMTQLQYLQDHLFHASLNMPNQMIKASCTPVGTFEPVQCVHNLRSDRAGDCFCINPRGVILSSRTRSPQKPDCGDVDHCPQRACNLTSCEHGLTADRHGCLVCQCKHACDGACEHDPAKRCVVETQASCGRENWEGTCTSGVCRLRLKAGTCPASVSANMTELAILRSPNRIGSCHVTCLDDADCPDTLKCCGVCGSRCVMPEEDTCQVHHVNARQEYEFLTQLQDSLLKGQIDTSRASRIIVGRLEAIKLMKNTWVPACVDDGSYNLTQCATKFSNKSTEAVCFCVDRHGNRIPGTQAETIAETNCAAKPGKCPFLQPNASAIHNCLSDYDCHDNTKCCSHGLGSQCVEPHEEEQGAAISLDLVVNVLCSFAGDLCGQNGACVNRFFTEGRVCECNSGYHGVFCEQKGSEAGGLTPCKRRKALKEYLLQKLLLLRQIQTRGKQIYGHNRPFKLTDPSCLPDGGFAAAQCNYHMDTKQKMDCFCVDRNGKPLEGTNVPGDQTPACARANPCDVETPLHHVGNGSAVSCGAQVGNCVPGYGCQAGRYGELYCCRSRTGNLDRCQLPPNPGPDCQYYENGSPQVTQQRFYFDQRSKQPLCKPFTYKGCSKTKPNFASKAACETRCIRNEHEGRCPAKIVVAPRAVCRDSCQGDSSCPEERKCCNTTCGYHCVLALNMEGAQCAIGQPLMDPVQNQPMSCSNDKGCEPAYQCRNGRCCLRSSDQVCTLPQLHGPCEEYVTRYFFNPDSKQCETFVYGGCGGNDNNFRTKAECCMMCGEGRCKEGTCPAPRPVLSVSCDHSCLGDGGCLADQICCNSSCGGSACVIPKPSASSQAALSCVDMLGDYRQKMAKAKGCFLQPKPRCDSRGQWERQQCNNKLGVCWCVTPNGFVVPKTRARGMARCQWVTPAMMLEADQMGMENDKGDQCQVCPGGETVHCCNEDLCRQVCPADPGAVCRINPCGGCSAVFYNSENRVVDCAKGLTECQLFRQHALLAGSKQRIVTFAAESRKRKIPPYIKTAGNTHGQVPYSIKGIPYRCQLPPDTGSCLAHSAKWFYNVTSQSCEVFIYGLCGGNENRFHTPEDCYAECHAAASPCHRKTCGGGKKCALNYRSGCFSGNCGLTTVCADKLPDYRVRGAFVPHCTGSGKFQFRQCHAGLCWCVTDGGVYKDGLTTDSSLKCSEKGPVKRGRTSVACPGGGKPRLDCINKCDTVSCPGQPSARCVIDLCTCETSFVGTNGRPVVCKSDQCQVDVFTKAEKNCPYEQACGGRGPKGCEYQDRCQSTLCPANPCAVCTHDPCTGQANFVDKLTGAAIKKEDCDRVTHTNCQIRKCEVQTLNARAAYGETLLVDPDCMEDGSYNPQQRRPDNTVYCVNDFGEAVPTPKSGVCVRDALVSMAISVTYIGDYDTIVPSRKGKIKTAFVDVMDKIGIKSAMVSDVEVVKGSIVIKANIINDPSSTLDFAIVKPLIQSKAVAGELTLRVDGIELRVAGGAGGGVLVVPTTASMVQPEVASGGLSGGAVAGIVIVLLLLGGVGGGAAFYFLYYRKRLEGPEAGEGKRMEGHDNRGFDMPGSRQGKKTANDPDFVEHSMDDHYVKVRI